MVVGYGIIGLRIPEAGSLKEKRSVIQKMIKRAQNEFNVSIAQTGDLDRHRFAQIGFSMTGNDSRVVSGKIDHLLRFMGDFDQAEIMNTQVEIMVVSDFPETPDGWAGKYDEF